MIHLEFIYILDKLRIAMYKYIILNISKSFKNQLKSVDHIHNRGAKLDSNIKK